MKDRKWTLSVGLSAGVLAAVLLGCSANVSEERAGLSSPATSTAGPQGGAGPASGGDLTGHWEGTSVSRCFSVRGFMVGRCAATQQIAMNFIQQEDGGVSGTYNCYSGSQGCLGENSKISRGSTWTDGRLSMRIAVEAGADRLSCIFNGVQHAEEIGGSYVCYAGGGIVEQGQFEVTRQY